MQMVSNNLVTRTFFIKLMEEAQLYNTVRNFYLVLQFISAFVSVFMITQYTKSNPLYCTL